MHAGKAGKMVVRTAAFTPEETQRVHDLTNAVNREPGLYRKQFRV